jgi:uncharacterized protein (TIGR01777 family)
MKTILITGGTGLVGKALTDLILSKGYKVVILSRSPQQQIITSPDISYAFWNVEKKIIDIEALQQADHIIHLAGAGVMDKKWTDSYKKEIVNSRVSSSELLVETLRNHPNKIKSIISSSAIGWYGPDIHNDHSFKEEELAANDFLGKTCKQWEESISSAEKLGIRVCKLRTGIVLSNEGGALPEFKKTLKWGVAGILGSGRQMVSWIHITDLCQMFLYAIENHKINGSYNAVSPHPINNKTLIYKLGHYIKNDKFIPIYVPSFLLKIMMGQRSIEVLKSTRVDAEKIINSGFEFKFPNIDVALKNLITQ